MTRVVAVVQARMGSQRFPGKVLEPLGDRPLIDWVVQRASRAASVDEVVVATSSEVADDPLAQHCSTRGYPCSRGSLTDVLDRVRAAAVATAADHVVRITADCPLIDPAVVDLVVHVHLTQGLDFTANRLPPPHRRTYPIGLDVEVATRAALETAWIQASSAHEREHVMPYLYEVPGRFALSVVESPVDAGDVRWTVDTPADLAAVTGLVRAAAATLDTGWLELLDVWRAHPELAALNASVPQRSGTDTDPRA